MAKTPTKYGGLADVYDEPLVYKELSELHNTERSVYKSLHVFPDVDTHNMPVCMPQDDGVHGTREHLGIFSQTK